MIKHIFSALTSFFGGAYLIYIVYLNYTEGISVFSRNSIAMLIISFIPLNEALKAVLKLRNKKK